LELDDNLMRLFKAAAFTLFSSLFDLKISALVDLFVVNILFYRWLCSSLVPDLDLKTFPLLPDPSSVYWDSISFGI
jgi:hypothetical protein